MNGSVRVRLSVMMFLEYVIWGAWLPLLNNYLDQIGMSGDQKGWINSAFALASLVTIMIGGQLADKYFAAQRVLGVCQLFAAIAILLIPMFPTFEMVMTLMLLHCVFYAPTMALTNAISFANLPDSKDFGAIRLWGTIGWIAASVPMILLLDPGYRKEFGLPPQVDYSVIFYVSGAAAFALAVFSLVLPHTPPMANKEEASSFGKALGVLTQPVMLVLFIVTFMDMIVHSAYFFFTGRFLGHLGVPSPWIMPAMSVGQIAEIFTMMILATVIKKLGWKLTLTLGILGHAVRFFVFYLCTPEMLWLAIVINVLHGVCYAFFFAAVFIYIDEHFPKDIRNNAQGLFNVAVLGIGVLIGNLVWGKVESMYTGPEPAKALDFPGIFSVATGAALVTAVFFIIAFHPPRTSKEPEKEYAA